MNTVTYVPSQCKGDDAEFEGKVVLVPPTFDQREDYREIMMDFATEFDQEQLENIQEDPKAAEKKENRELIKSMLKFKRELVKCSVDHYKEVELKRKCDGKEFKSFEDMTYWTDLDPMIHEIADFITKGQSPEKK